MKFPLRSGTRTVTTETRSESGSGPTSYTKRVVTETTIGPDGRKQVVTKETVTRDGHDSSSDDVSLATYLYRMSAHHGFCCEFGCCFCSAGLAVSNTVYNVVVVFRIQFVLYAVILVLFSSATV